MAKHRPLLLVNIILLSPMAASESGEQHYSPSGVWFLSNSSICCHFCCLNQQVTNFFFLAGCRYFTFILFYFFKGLFAENSCPPQLEMMLINAARSADTVKILIPILSITWPSAPPTCSPVSHFPLQNWIIPFLLTPWRTVEDPIEISAFFFEPLERDHYSDPVPSPALPPVSPLMLTPAWQWHITDVSFNNQQTLSKFLYRCMLLCVYSPVSMEKCCHKR